MRKAISIVLLFSIMLLTGCTVEADRIYVVCRNDGGSLYCYKNDSEFFMLTPKGNLIPCMDLTLRAYPALTFTPCDGDYNIVPDIPNLYTGTKTDLEHYVSKLLHNDFSDYEVVYSDYQRLEIFLYSDSDSYRILYNIYGEIRIYSENNLPILYINEK